MKTKQIFLISILILWFNAVTADISPLNIDEDNIDLFLPVPEFSTEYYRLRRSYQPFGMASTLDFETAIVQASTGSVRITQLKINGVNHWADLTIQLTPKDLVLKVIGAGTGDPPTDFPRWTDSFPELELDFNLSSADIFGPPARIRLFDVAINERLYDIDFILDIETNFIFSNVHPKGFILYSMTPDEQQIFIVSSQSDQLFAYVNQDYLDYSNTAFLSPLALPWNGEDGEQSILINYAASSQLQTMMATDGILLGTYTPPYSIQMARSAASISHKAELETELNQCIDKKTQLIAGFKADNNLSQQLTDMVFSLAGHSSLTALSSQTTQKIVAAIADSKDVVLEMMANGKVDEATLGVYVSSTLMKSLTPDEYQIFIKQIWGNNIPANVQAAAKTAGGVVETDYKLAAQALAEGIANHAFPLYTTAAKTVIQTVKYAKDTLADNAFHELYKIYKGSGGNWEDVVNASVLSTNKYADQKIREILKSQNKDYDDNAVSEYLEEKMRALYAQEPQMTADREKLQQVKASYLNLSTSEIEVLKKRSGGVGSASQCDLLQQYLAYVTKTELDLKNSSRNCSDPNLAPTQSDIESHALFITKYKLREGNRAEIKAAYQKDKLSWLKSNRCLNYVEPSSQPPVDDGFWVLAETIALSNYDQYKNTCYIVSGNISAGSYSTTSSVSDNACNWDYSESVTFTGSWTSPPETLIPGAVYPATLSLTRSNPIEQWGADDYIFMYMDKYTTECGFVTASKTYINTESVAVNWNKATPSSASWSGTYTAPELGYAGSSESKKFQIKAGGRGGCVRYIYEWSDSYSIF